MVKRVVFLMPIPIHHLPQAPLFCSKNEGQWHRDVFPMCYDSDGLWLAIFHSYYVAKFLQSQCHTAGHAQRRGTKVHVDDQQDPDGSHTRLPDS